MLGANVTTGNPIKGAAFVVFFSFLAISMLAAVSEGKCIRDRAGVGADDPSFGSQPKMGNTAITSTPQRF